MALKAIVDNLDSVAKELQPHYVKTDDGKYRLDAEGVEDVTGLKTALDRERDASREAMKKLKLFEGIEDPAAAIKALETMKTIDLKKMVDAGEVDKVRKEISDSYDRKIADLTKSVQDKDSHIYKLEVSNRFASSKFINEKTVLPPDIAEATFGKNFKIENGQVVGYIGENRIYSRKNPSALADVDEALEVLVEAYPLKDRILKGSGQSGSGSRQGGGSGGSGKTATLAEYNDMRPTERAAFMAGGGTLTD